MLTQCGCVELLAGVLAGALALSCVEATVAVDPEGSGGAGVGVQTASSTVATNSGAGAGGATCAELPALPLSPVGSCNVKSGLYCGGNKVSGDSGSLFLCDNGGLYLHKACAFGCDPQDDGLQDRCKAGSARAIAETWLQRPAPAHFLFGLGNDLSTEHAQPAAYELGAPLDIHDVTLTNEEPGAAWVDWSPGGGCFVDRMVHEARDRGMVPMFNYAVLSRELETQGAIGLPSAAYWADVLLFLERLGATGEPAIVVIEPRLFDYAINHWGVQTQQDFNLPGDCSGWLFGSFPGMSRCWSHLAHTRAPNAVLALPVVTTSFDVAAAESAVGYLRQIGADAFDLVALRPFERDAGCYEAGACPSNSSGPWYWDDASFSDHLVWASTISAGLDRALLWHQLPLGEDGDAPGAPLHYRDNRVKYAFERTEELASVNPLGALGAVFGRGDTQQTSTETDHGQLRDAVNAYLKAPTSLP